MPLARTIVSLALLASLGLAAQAAAATPKLLRFTAEGRIASGAVAKYDLREESTAFQYRIRAERIAVRVFKRAGTKWRRVGLVRSSPPRPLNFWRVFRRMDVGRYRLVARAVNGSGEDAEQSAARTIRFRVATHIPHTD